MNTTWSRWRSRVLAAASAAVVAVPVLATTGSSGASPPRATQPVLYTWGTNVGAFPPIRYDPGPLQLPGGVVPKAVEAGGSHSGFVIGANGTLYGWGLNTCGEIGDGRTAPAFTPEAIPLPGGTEVQQAAGGDCFTVALGSDGHLYTWGANDKGQLGDGTTTPHLTPHEIALPGGITATAVTAVGSFALAVGSNGQVYGWGANGTGQLGTQTPSVALSPQLVPLPSNMRVTAVTAGSGLGPTTGFGLALDSSGDIYSWGDNRSGALGRTPIAVDQSPGLVDNMGSASGRVVTAISAGDDFTEALTNTGQVYAWGSNQSGQLGHREESFVPDPAAAPVFLDQDVDPVTNILNIGKSAFAVGHDGKLWGWGLNENPILGTGQSGPQHCRSGVQCALTPVEANLPAGAKILSLGRNANAAAVIVSAPAGVSRTSH
jgi:alpha-tubulin suppressor-like RCC1 family protein